MYAFDVCASFLDFLFPFFYHTSSIYCDSIACLLVGRYIYKMIIIIQFGFIS